MRPFDWFSIAPAKVLAGSGTRVMRRRMQCRSWQADLSQLEVCKKANDGNNAGAITFARDHIAATHIAA